LNTLEGGETIWPLRMIMKGTLLLVTLLLSNTSAAVFSAPQQKPELASKILALENKWNEAYKQGDVTTMNSLLADDFIITVEDGATFSKAGYIAHSADSDNHVLISEMSDLKVRMHGNTAVVTGAYHEKGISNGKPYEYHDRLTDVWMMIDGRWQVIASHYAIPVK
jgi:ketosteroid isomerase-like protein